MDLIVNKGSQSQHSRRMRLRDIKHHVYHVKELVFYEGSLRPTSTTDQ